MPLIRPRYLATLAALLLCGTPLLHAHDNHADMQEAANRFLASLSPEQKSQATFALDNAERLNWHFIPRDRKGLSLGQMAPEQRHLAIGLLGSALSQKGLLKATTIMSLEAILKEMEQGSGPVRDPQAYYVSIFGQPHASNPWGWRFEGHHLVLNFSIVDGHPVAVTPNLLGSNPGEVRSGPRQGLRTLGNEEDLGRQLMHALTKEQQVKATVMDKAPSDVLLVPGRDVTLLEPLGLPASELTTSQLTLLHTLVEEYILRYRADLMTEELSQFNSTPLTSIYFAWAGGTEPGQPHYYRVQTTKFVIEYDNTQNNANHVHALWRDLKNDFGQDILRDHYQHSNHHQH